MDAKRKDSHLGILTKETTNYNHKNEKTQGNSPDFCVAQTSKLVQFSVRNI